MTETQSRSLSLDELRMGSRFLFRLPSFLNHPWTPATAKTGLESRLRRREDNFLDMVRHSIFENEESPYKKLFTHAGCAYGDLERLATKDGVEATLRILLRAGVYLSIDEFKGRQPAYRGHTVIPISPEGLRNPRSRFHVAMKSGGSRSAGTTVVFDLDFIRTCAADTGLALHGRGGDDWDKATWEVPGGGAWFSLLEFSQFGKPPVGWFSQIDPSHRDIHPRYRWSNRAFLWGSRFSRTPMPSPRYAPLDNPRPIVHWIADCLRERKTPYLLTYPSSALRLCQEARRTGTDLTGAQFTIAGEPCTPARMGAICSTGAKVLPKYAIMETGPVGYGCLHPESSDDIHLLKDLHALIQPDDLEAGGGFLPGTVLFTSLVPAAPITLLNVSMGDQAKIVRRSCGCPLQGMGWTDHMTSIQSHEKLTCGGMNFLDADVARVLDEVLPARFGGGPTDYQLVEEEKEDGRPELRLLVHPRLGPLNEQDVVQSFFEEIGRSGGANEVMGLAWQEGKLLKVELRTPLSTPSGKILHLHVPAPAGRAAVPGQGRSTQEQTGRTEEKSS